MKQLKKFCVGVLLLVTLAAMTACGKADNGTTTDNNGAAGNNGTVTDDNNGTGTNVDDILFDTDGDGLLEEIGRDTNDVVDDLVNDMTGDDTMVDGNVNDDNAADGTVGNGTETDLP